MRYWRQEEDVDGEGVDGEEGRLNVEKRMMLRR